MNSPFGNRLLVTFGVAMLVLVVPVAASATAATRSIYVPGDYPTIQAAVDAAPSGATVHVGPGTYPEQVVIGKDLTIAGSGVDATVIQSPATLTPFAVNTRINSPLAAIVRVGHGAQVRISGLTVSGPIPCTAVEGVAVVQAATLDLFQARVRDITHEASCPGVSALAVDYGLPPFMQLEGVPGGTDAFGRADHVAVDNYQEFGFIATGPPGVVPTAVTLTDNVITSGSPAVPTEQLAIFVTGAAAARITGNTVTGGVCDIPGCGPDPINEYQAIGVAAAPAGPGTTISGNHISSSDVGVLQFASPNCCAISDNTLQDNRYFGIVIQDGDGTTRDNTISGGQTGIAIVADAADTTGVLRGDIITGTSIAPVREIDCCGYAAIAIVKAQ
jgi:parallel beta-helix repeat protein